MSKEFEFGDLKRVVSSILLSAPSGRTQKQLLDDYEKLLGRALPYRAFGYKTLLECLEDMRDSVRIQRNGLDCVLFGVGNESTKHIQKLISRQKQSPPRGRQNTTVAQCVVPDRFKAQLRELLLSYSDGLRHDKFSEAYAKRFGCYANYRCWGFGSLDHMFRAIPDVVTCQHDNTKNVYIIRLNKQTVKSTTETSVSRKLGAQAPQEVSLNSLELTPDEITTAKKPTAPCVLKDIERKVEQFLAAKCSGIWASKFAVEYKIHFGEDFPCKENVLGLLSSLGVCELESHTSTSDWLVWPKGRKHSKATEVEAAEQGVPEELSVAITSMVAKYPRGIPLVKFKQVFKEKCGRELPYSQHDFYSVAEMLVHVPGIRVEKPSTSSEVLVLPAHPEQARPSEGVEGEPVEKPKSPKVALEHIPSGYSRQPPPSEKTCPVYVSYVKSPSCVFVQVIGETTTRALESLSEDMSQFYSSKEGLKYSIECVKMGQACCTVYSEDCYWYRAEVVAIPDPDVVKVKYVDYGNVGLVPRVTLRRPKAHYMLLPAQAVECRLANIRPPSEKWCERASLLLSTMTKDRPLVATVTSVRSNILSLYLCDTNTDKDIHINDVLVNQGLAVVARDTEKDEAGFDAIHLEPPLSVSSEDVANIRPPTSCLAPPSSSLLTADALAAYFQQALWQLGQLAQLPPPVTTSNNTSSISTSSALPHISSASPSSTTSDHSINPVQWEMSDQDSSSSLKDSSSGLKDSRGGLKDSSSGLKDSRGGLKDSSGGLKDSSSGLKDSSGGLKDSSGGLKDSTCRGGLKDSSGGLKDSKDSRGGLKDSSGGLKDSKDSRGGLKDSSGGLKDSSGGLRDSSSYITSASSNISCTSSNDHSSLGVQRRLVKRVQLTPTHTLHVLSHCQKALVLSCEVSSWFWEGDQLKSRLQQASRQIWAQVLTKSHAPELFKELMNTDLHHIKQHSTMMTYCLEDLPAIVQTFDGPPELLVSIRRELSLWKSTPSADYFSCGGPIEVLEAKLQDLHAQRSHAIKELSDSLMLDELGDAPGRLVNIESEIRLVKSKITDMRRLLAATKTKSSQMVLSMVPLAPSSNGCSPKQGPLLQLDTTQTIQSDKSIPTQPIQSDKSIQPIQSDKPIPTQTIQSDKSVPTQTIQSDKSIPTQPIQSDKPIPTQTIQSDKSVPTQTIQSDKSIPTQPIQSDKSVPTQTIQSDKSLPTQPIQSGKSIPTQTIQSDKSISNQSKQTTPITHTSISSGAVMSKEVTFQRLPGRVPGLGRGTPYIKPSRNTM